MFPAPNKAPPSLTTKLFRSPVRVSAPTLVRTAPSEIVITLSCPLAPPTVSAPALRFQTPPLPAPLVLVTNPVRLPPAPMVVAPAVNNFPPLFSTIVPLVPSHVKVVIPVTTPPLSICSRPPLPNANVLFVRFTPVAAALLVTTNHASPRLLEMASVPSVVVVGLKLMTLV
ncbi:MAG: hypothetical protein PCFJNLEI_00962 [Verrucomicrobiae bacterium]|nr:hypothetical protein [Verrucomicrobiae bacterium]